MVRYALLWMLIFSSIAISARYIYNYLYSDQELLSLKTGLKFAEEDVLGKNLYKEVCERSSYSEKVEILNSTKEVNKSGAWIFKFHPVRGKENKCPAVTILVSRYTGEAWVKNLEK